MATINFATREITAKIVYFGARGAGCNTNVARLHALVQARRRSELAKVTAPEGEEEHSWCFDYLAQGAGPLEGFGMCWQVWSLPGGLQTELQREQILRGLDAVVFVADARDGRNETNVEALLQLEALLGRLGHELSHTTVVLQVNHTDAEGARPQVDVVFDLNPYGFPVSDAVASDGTGILETHGDVVSAVVTRIADAIAGHPSPVILTAVHDPDRNAADTALRRHQETTHPAARVEEQAELSEEPLEERSLVSEELAELPEGPRIEVPFQPREFVGSHPVRVLGASVDGDRVSVELVMERMGGGETRRLTVVLANRPTDTPPMPRVSPVSPEPKPDAAPSVFDYLPESVEIGEESEEGASDFPAVWYGVLGVAGGVLIGFLSAVLLSGLLP